MTRMDSKKMDDVVKELYRIWRAGRDNPLRKRLTDGEKASYVSRKYGVKVSEDQVWRLRKNFETGYVRVEGGEVVRAGCYRGIVAEEKRVERALFELGIFDREVYREACRRLQGGEGSDSVIANLEHRRFVNPHIHIPNPAKPEERPLHLQNYLVGPASAEARRILGEKYGSLHVPFGEHRKLTGRLLREWYRGMKGRFKH